MSFEAVCDLLAKSQPEAKNAATKTIRIKFFFINYLTPRFCLLSATPSLKLASAQPAYFPNISVLFAHVEFNGIHAQLDARTGNALLAAADFDVLND